MISGQLSVISGAKHLRKQANNLISLFRLNAPYRLVLVLVALIGLRIPFFLEDLVPTVTVFRWMLIGEQLSGGDVLYTRTGVFNVIWP